MAGLFDLGVGDLGPKRDENVVYDVVIVGAGPAGMTTAIYSARDGKKTLVLEKQIAGGLAGTTHLIENYPGFPDGVSGEKLMNLFKEQAMNFGAQFVEFEEVKQIEKKEGIFHVTTDVGNTYRGKAVLLATGSAPIRLDVPGEKELYGRGVSYCATCDGPLFKGKDVVVVGCGNSGLQEALTLLDYVKSIAFVEFLPTSKAEKILRDRVMNHPKSTCYFNHMVTAIKGEGSVSAVSVKNRETGEEFDIPVQGVFIYVGYKPYTDFVKGLVELDERGYIITNDHMTTSVPGIFAAGDVRSGNLAQVAVAVGDGAKAAVSIREYLQEQE